MSISTKKIKSLPDSSGVYIFHDKQGKILYIGKATSLKDRVRSYFSYPQKNSRPIEAMIHEVIAIEVKKTDTVLEALILEANLIKKYQPKYNIIGKDDKSFSYFVITKEEFPRILIARKTDLDTKYPAIAGPRQGGGHIPATNLYGPYTSKKQMEIALKILRRIFPIHIKKQPTEKGCLDYQIGLCPGPYAGAISKEDYQKNINGIKMIFKGKKKSLLKKMEKEMKELAKKHEFEKAADLRNKIFALKHIQDVALISSDDNILGTRYQIPDTRIEAYDISDISGQYATGSMVVFKGREPDKSSYRKFRIKTVESINDVGAMGEVLNRRFRNDWPHPNLIVVDGGKGHLNMASAVLETFHLNIPTIAVAKGPTRKKLEIFKSRQIFSSDIEKLISDKHFLAHITREAHRFAISYHRKLRGKESILN